MQYARFNEDCSWVTGGGYSTLLSDHPTYKDREVFHTDPWDPIWGQKGSEEKKKAKDLWEHLEEENRGFLYIYGLIPYENVVAIDELGDNLAGIPHVYVEFMDRIGAFSRSVSCVKLCQKNSFECIFIPADENYKINKFEI